MKQYLPTFASRFSLAQGGKDFHFSLDGITFFNDE